MQTFRRLWIAIQLNFLMKLPLFRQFISLRSRTHPQTKKGKSAFLSNLLEYASGDKEQKYIVKKKLDLKTWLAHFWVTRKHI